MPNGEISRQYFDLDYSGYAIEHFPFFEKEHPRFEARFARTVDTAYDRWPWMTDEVFLDALSDALDDFLVHIYSISEEQYSDLVEHEDISLYKIVKAAVSSLGVLMRYLRQNVETDDLLDLPPYEEWIHSFYDAWPMKGCPTSELGISTPVWT